MTRVMPVFRNYEGYPDPTAGRALANIAREEKKAEAARRMAEEPTLTDNDAAKRRNGRKKKRWPKIEVMRW